jgi:hypothetical protein
MLILALAFALKPLLVDKLAQTLKIVLALELEMVMRTMVWRWHWRWW